MASVNIHIWEYIQLVKSGRVPVCKEQIQLIRLVERVFETEDIYVDEAQLEEYLGYQKYFPFDLFPWEKFCFALHCCTYTADGFPRFPDLYIIGGRGLGKNGYLAFEDFCLITPTNPVKNYHIYIYAMSEDQSKRSWQDIYDILEDNKPKMQRHFYWTKEYIQHRKTKSEIRYKSNNTKTMDSFRPGKVDHDEAHAYENSKNVTTPVTGLGKVPQPRRTVVTTNGNVRGGYLDEVMNDGLEVLSGEAPDNGALYFICRLDTDEEIDAPEMWPKANPSLPYLPHLRKEIEKEYRDYVKNPIVNADFATKRMNRPPHETEGEVATWEQIAATNKPIDEEKIKGLPCVAGIDYMKTNDFLGAGLLYIVDGMHYWVRHGWVCSRSADLKRVKAPLNDWADMGLLTFVDAPEISPELPAVWLVNEAAKRGSVILKCGIDYYRYTVLKRALETVNITADKGGIIKLIRPSDEMLKVPVITSGFTNEIFCWGDDPFMRWNANNAKLITSGAGNITYGKIEPKSRKTDLFKAFVMAECVSDVLESSAVSVDEKYYDVQIYD